MNKVRWFPPAPDPVLYVSIGNSDDKLPQAEWARFHADVALAVKTFIYNASDRSICDVDLVGVWESASTAPWQNACWAVRVPANTDPGSVEEFRCALKRCAADYGQDCIAWAMAPTTDFLAADDA